MHHFPARGGHLVGLVRSVRMVCLVGFVPVPKKPKNITNRPKLSGGAARGGSVLSPASPLNVSRPCAPGGTKPLTLNQRLFDQSPAISTLVVRVVIEST